MIEAINYPIGIDISDLSLKFVQLAKSRDRIVLKAFSSIKIKKGIIENGEIKNRDLFVSSLKEMLDKPLYGKASGDEAVVCLPEPQTFIKLLKIESSQNKIKDEIKKQLENFFPVSVEDVYFDWQEIPSEFEKTLVLIGASPKNFVDDYISILKDAKLSVVACEIESVAISRAILQEESPHFKSQGTRKTYGIIDIGASRSSFFAYSQDTILFDISMPISGENITKKISKSLELDMSKAELAKISIGKNSKKANELVKKALVDTADKLINKIESILEFHSSHFSEFGKIEKIYICGGGANIENIDELIQKKISIPISIADPLINVKKNENILKEFEEIYDLRLDLNDKKSKDDSSTYKQSSITNYTTAIGLALRSIFLE